MSICVYVSNVSEKISQILSIDEIFLTSRFYIFHIHERCDAKNVDRIL